MDGDGTPHKEKSLPSHDHFQSSAAVHSIPTRPTDSCPRFLSLFATGVHRPRACHFFLGTFLPFRLASDRPMAIACFRLFTFLPLPLFNVPFLRLCIARLTDFLAPLPYLAIMPSFQIRRVATSAVPSMDVPLFFGSASAGS